MTLLDLVSQEVTLRQRGKEWLGLCPFHAEKTPSFSVNPEKGLYFCYGCQAAGDAITWLRTRRFLSFREAAALVGKPLAESDTERHSRERAVKESLLLDYARWCAVQLVFWCNTYRELTGEITVAEIGYRATTVHPEFYTEAEADYWATRLASLYDVLPQVEYRCDLLTYDRHAAERWEWWRKDQMRA